MPAVAQCDMIPFSVRRQMTRDEAKMGNRRWHPFLINVCSVVKARSAPVASRHSIRYPLSRSTVYIRGARAPRGTQESGPLHPSAVPRRVLRWQDMQIDEGHWLRQLPSVCW